MARELPGWTFDRQDPFWILARAPGARPPGQGWKLHLSGTPATAGKVLEGALPVLRRELADFKVAASADHLAKLNEGEAGITQIGKFVTVYPRDDTHAVRVSIALDQATRGLCGPAVPSDRPLRRGSLVHYRYGGFDGRVLQLPYGEIVAAIAAPDGELVPDRRDTIYSPPDWAGDPFLTAGVADEWEPIPVLLDRRILLAAVLHASPRGTVHLAIDIENGRRCVVKRATRGTSLADDGRDAVKQLNHELSVLTRLAGYSGIPQAYELIEGEHESYLVLEDVAGVSLAELVSTKRPLGLSLPLDDVIGLGAAVADVVQGVHDCGFVHRDLKPTNVVVGEDGGVTLVDFELAHELGSSAPAWGLGTRGYLSPQQAAGAPPSPTDDVYALGGLVYFLASGAEPTHVPDETSIAARPLELLRPAASGRMATVVARCLDPSPHRRFRTMADAAAALRDRRDEATRPALGPRPRRREAESWTRVAGRLGESIVRLGVPVLGGRGLAWRSARQQSQGLMGRDVNTGAAGVVLALAELAGAHSGARFVPPLARAVASLLAVPPASDPPLPGMYVGEAGVAVALLKAGRVLGRTDLVTAALERGRCVATLPYGSPDMFNGSAGRVRAHLMLWDETDAAEQLDAAATAGEAILASADPVGVDELHWPIPNGYGPLSGNSYNGYAHGTAGVVDALLDLWEATGDERFRDSAEAGLRRLGRLALASLDDGSGLEWSIQEGSRPAGPMWCHGSAGVARVAAHAARHAQFRHYEQLARRAALSVAHGGRSLGPVLCHGLAGGVEALLDVYALTGDARLLAHATDLAELLTGFLFQRDGMLVCSSDTPHIVTPDYMVGIGGVVVALLRLDDPSREHQLSRLAPRAEPVASQPREELPKRPDMGAPAATQGGR